MSLWWARQCFSVNLLFFKKMNFKKNYFRRHVSTSDNPALPRAARYTSGENKITGILSLDFTSMYLSVQQKPIPTSPGLYWYRRENGKFSKKIMTPGHSLEAQQWLCYRQETGFNYYI